jgi:hypothetical protein
MKNTLKVNNSFQYAGCTYFITNIKENTIRAYRWMRNETDGKWIPYYMKFDKSFVQMVMNNPNYYH